MSPHPGLLLHSALHAIYASYIALFAAEVAMLIVVIEKAVFATAVVNITVNIVTASFV